MKFINLTPHEIHETITNTVIPPSGTVARIQMTTDQRDTVDGIPIYRTVQIGDIANLPAPKPDTMYIVSALCLNAVPSYRTDVVCPGNAQRNSDGTVRGCYGFRTK